MHKVLKSMVDSVMRQDDLLLSYQTHTLVKNIYLSSYTEVIQEHFVITF